MSNEPAYVGRVFGVKQATVTDMDGTPGWEITFMVTCPIGEVPLRGDDIHYILRRKEIRDEDTSNG